MPTIPGKDRRKRSLPLLVAGLLAMGGVIWLVWSSVRPGVGSTTDTPHSQGDDSGSVDGTRQEGESGSSDRPDRTKTGTREGEGGVETGEKREVPQFPLMDQVLADESLSNSQAAARLLEIVGNQTVSLLEREEALAHGLDLDLPQFLGIATDPSTPQPLAQRFFDEMLNHNDKRDLQVRACIALVDHQDAGIRQEAAEQLAFYIGMEEWVEQPETLKQEAYRFLEEWAKRPKSPPIPKDPDGEIPETAPLNPLQVDENAED